MIKNIIFDFDGTIADSYKYVYTIIKDLSQKYLKKEIKPSQLKELRNHNTKEIFKRLGFQLWKMPFYVKKIQRELFNDIDNIKPFKGIKEVLNKLDNSNYSLLILTTNIKENVVRFLDNYNLHRFKTIVSGSTLFGKKQALKKMLKNYNLKSDECIYIGDETRDIEASQKNNVKVIAVTWGFNGKKILQEYKPDFLADKPEDILTYLKKINYSK